MTIIVKKPFEPFDIENRGVKNVNDTAVVHPEFEEKPVLPGTSQSSEETHGGSELTFSLPNSSQSNEHTANNQADQNNASSPSNADTNNDNAADNSDNKGVQEHNEGGSNGTQEPQSTANDTDQIAQEQENANAESSGDNQGGGDGNGDNDVEDQGQDSTTNADDGSNQEQENGDNNEQNSENDGEDEESESEDTNEQAQSGTYNMQQVVDVTSGNINARYYQTEFYRFIELIAEEKAKTYDPMGSEEYNVKKLMFRQYERKPLSSYKMSRVRESVVILLDNSGSMMWWSDNLQILADLAMQRNDVEVYLAPNGHIEEMIYPKRQLVNHDDVMKRLRNRRIIYVGDFDGADTPIELSWYNDVIWICPEERYIHFLEHDWVHYDESRFRGAFLRVFTLQELFGAFRKLLSTPALRFWYDLCNKAHRCGGGDDA